jgi:carboxypeptidase T
MALIVFFLYLRPAVAEIYSLVRVEISDKSDIAEILAKTGEGESVSEYNFEEGYIEIYLSSSELEILTDLDFNYGTIIPDVEKYYSQQHIGLTMGGFRTYSEIGAKIDSLEADYPAILRVDSIGHSHQSNTIWAVKISDNVNIEEDEPEVLFTGITHAREPIGGAICLDFMEWLCVNYGEDPVATDIVNNRQVWFIFTINRPIPTAAVCGARTAAITVAATGSITIAITLITGDMTTAAPRHIRQARLIGGLQQARNRKTRR